MKKQKIGDFQPKFQHNSSKSRNRVTVNNKKTSKLILKTFFFCLTPEVWKKDFQLLAKSTEIQVADLFYFFGRHLSFERKATKFQYTGHKLRQHFHLAFFWHLLTLDLAFLLNLIWQPCKLVDRLVMSLPFIQVLCRA